MLGVSFGGTSYRESYAYDASDGSLTTLNTAVGTKIGYNYDALKRLRSRAIYQGSTPLFENRYAYATQSGNQSTALVEFFNYRLASDDGNGDIIVGYQYEYDKGGNITDIKAEVDGALIPLEHYEYDEKQGQLKTAIRYENGEEADRWTYSYDTAGNILSEDHEGSNSELHEHAYEDGRWGDLLTSVDGIDLEYDGSGNPTFYANGTELLWSMEWQNGRQLSRATTERDSTTEDVLDFAYDANGIRTSKTVTRNTSRPVQPYKVTFVADGKTVKTMNVTEGYTLKDSDYPAVPEKAGYTGAWQRYTSPVQSNVTVSVTYTKITTYYTVTFVADGFTVKTMQVYSGYILKDSDYPSVPEKLGYEGTWQKHTTAVMGNVTVQATYRKMLPLQVQFYAEETLLKSMQVEYGYRLVDSDYPDIPEKPGYRSWWSKHSDRIIAPLDIYASYEDSMGIIDPVKPSTVDSEPTEEPWEPIEPNAAPTEEPDIEEQDLSKSDWTLASTETVTHEYLTQSGKVVRETITTSMDTTTLDFFYDDSGRPFAFNYSVDGSDFETYYYILNLQGDVVQIIDEGGVLQAEYVYSPWGEVISAEGDLAEINPLRYRGYYYDSETGFYYLRSRYYDPENHRFINADSYASTGQGFLGTNTFAYCNNSPIQFSDATGRIIELSTDVNDGDAAQYNLAVGYLKNSELGSELIEKLESSTKVFTIVFISDDNMRYEPGTRTIYFDPYSGLVMKDQTSVQSAALGLAHEMGHAAQDLDNELNGMQYDIENANVAKYETPIAKQLGEPVRKDYTDAVACRRMNNSIHYTTTYCRPWWHYIAPWNWGKPRVSITEHNKFLN